jgi:hypothetical protein
VDGVRAVDLLRRVDGQALPPLGAAVRRLRRGFVRLRLPLIIVLSGGLALFAAVWGGGRSPVGDPGADGIARVGVPEGRSIPWYVEDSRR